MGWSKVGSGEIMDLKKDGKGTETVGTYLGRQENIGKFGTVLHHIEVDGKRKSVWGSAVLNNQLDQVAPETKIKIVYLGQQASQNGKNPMNMFDVFEDDGKEGEDVVEDSKTEEGKIPF